MTTKFILVSLFSITTLAACGNSEKTDNGATSDTTVIENPTQVQKDSAVLVDDTATVQTAVGVKDEEKAAKNDEQRDAEKLKKDEAAAAQKH
ncbi:MAG: hypothetical protein JSS78_04910 [Bacteroidetes bacterium]|nr:hypothetical protein [Bacteroidota bacterium]